MFICKAHYETHHCPLEIFLAAAADCCVACHFHRDAAIAAELEGGANQRTGLPTMDRPVARMW